MDWIFQALSTVLGAGVAYGAVRSDIRHLHEKVEQLREDTRENIVRAHARMDDVIKTVNIINLKGRA
ncbi:MAG: hypothetical protein LBF93_13110 [Zoogloeaceae bacterium]|jgi:hypothetical protein|nr:hypothetical protein [Zoogloeaceae bacterium]